MTEPTASGHFSLWQVIGIAASVIVVSAGAGWVAGRALLGDELEQYRKAEHWKVPDAIRKLEELSGRLNTTLEERSRLDKAARLAEERGKENGRLKKELDEKSRLLVEAESRLSALEGDTFQLSAGKSRFVIGRESAIGVTDTNPYTKDCYVQLGDKAEDMRPGRTVEATYGNQKARITLLEVSGDTCTFSLGQ